MLLTLQSGVRLGRRRNAQGHGKLEVSGAMIGATMMELQARLEHR